MLSQKVTNTQTIKNPKTIKPKIEKERHPYRLYTRIVKNTSLKINCCTGTNRDSKRNTCTKRRLGTDSSCVTGYLPCCGRVQTLHHGVMRPPLRRAAQPKHRQVQGQCQYQRHQVQGQCNARVSAIKCRANPTPGLAPSSARPIQRQGQSHYSGMCLANPSVSAMRQRRHAYLNNAQRQEETIHAGIPA